MSTGPGRALYPEERAEGDAPAAGARGPKLTDTVDVLADRTGRVGPLSYQVPPEMVIRRGDAVKVPFGKREAYGIVLGAGDPGKATRSLQEVYGKRVTAAELDFATRVAREHFCQLSTIAARLAPRDGKGAPAIDAGSVALNTARAVTGLAAIEATQRRRLLICAPLVDQTLVAAQEAARIAERGQVLILCPSVTVARATLAHFTSGASRLDPAATPGSWKGFAQGSVQVGVGTRTAALYSAEQLAGIIVVDEDHPGHREQAQPYTNARDLAISRSATFGIDLVLITSCASTRALAGSVKATAIGGRLQWPGVAVVNTRNEDPTRDLPESVLRVPRGRDALILVDSAPVYVCQRCSKLRRETNDGDSPTPCLRCGEPGLRQINWDAERARLSVPGFSPVTLEQLRPGSGRCVLLPAFDEALNQAGFEAERWAWHLLICAARAAGEGGTVIVVTRDRNHPALADLQARSLIDQARRSWAQAKQDRLPPFSLWVRVRCGTERPPATSGLPGRVLGPRKIGTDWELVIQATTQQRSAVERAVERLRRRGKVRIELL